MLKTLKQTNKTHYQDLLEGERWMYAARTTGEHNGLSIIVVGWRGHIEVPFEFCRGADLSIMTTYADELNNERRSPATTQSHFQPAYS
jgi:hypothetical protein